MNATERRLFIMNSLNDNGIVNLKKVAAVLNISELTVRRDFEKMEAAGKLKRVQGGAILEGESYDAELTMSKKLTLHMEEKIKVAKYAASYIKDNDCVFIDAGTSTAQLIDFISQKKIKVVTYNELVVRKLVNPVAEIFMIGGKYIPHHNMYIGSVAQDLLNQFRFDVGIFGCSGIDLEENIAYTTEMESLLMKKIALGNSAKSMLLIDSSKIQKKSFLCFSDLSKFDNVICGKHDLEIEIPSNFTMV